MSVRLMGARTLVRFLLLCFFTVLWSPAAFASESRPTPQTTNLLVHSDLDGDQVPDTALVREFDSDYVLSINLSSKPSWTSLPAFYTAEPVIGIEAMDVDGDHDRDIVLLGMNPFEPSGLWLNEGSKGFRSEQPWLAAAFEKQSGSKLFRLASESADIDPGSLDEPGPNAVVPHHVLPDTLEAEAGLSREPRDVPFTGQSSNVPLRGPPPFTL